MQLQPPSYCHSGAAFTAPGSKVAGEGLHTETIIGLISCGGAPLGNSSANRARLSAEERFARETPAASSAATSGELSETWLASCVSMPPGSRFNSSLRLDAGVL